MTRLVLGRALDQAAVWHRDGRRLAVSVNLSASSMIDSDLPDEVAAMLSARELPAGALQLEITEAFLMADRDRARNILTRLRAGGVQICIDDFGTGYSSLSYLRDLPIDELTRMGCDQAQGFHMSRPVPAAVLDHWLDERDAADALSQDCDLFTAESSC